MIIRNYDHLAKAMAAAYPTEKSISRAVYTSTACGAWLKFTAGLPGRYHDKVTRDWLLDIRRTIVGYQLVRGRLSTSQRWYTPDEFPLSLLTPLREGDGLQQAEFFKKWYLTNEETCDFVRMTLRHPVDKRKKYFHLEIDMDWWELYAPRITERDGFMIGSIVEGVEWAATPITILFPCHDSKLYDAIKQVEKDCQFIWDSTHGCEECGKDPETGDQCENEWGYISVDPNCPNCEGRGVVI